MAIITRDRFKLLNLTENQQVYVKPKDVKSFSIDYQI